MSANADQTDRHIQIQTPTESESEPASNKAGGPVPPQSPPAVFPVAVLVQAFPTALDYAKNGLQTHRDIAEVADLVRPMMGISPDAWTDAKEAMGPADAAVAILAILQRWDSIKSPGGYLRVLTAKKKANAFSIGPIVMASLNSRRQQAKAVKSAAGGAGDSNRPAAAGDSSWTISPALRQNLSKSPRRP
jgi:replication initiation protein RepC